MPRHTITKSAAIQTLKRVISDPHTHAHKSQANSDPYTETKTISAPLAETKAISVARSLPCYVMPLVQTSEKPCRRRSNPAMERVSSKNRLDDPAIIMSYWHWNIACTYKI